VKNTFNLSTNSFNPSVSCYFAGAFVRLTGSGMGCPDWPKCFGYYIPTEQQELLFAAGKEYDKGVIIKEEALLVAKMILYRSHLSTRTTGKNTRNMIMLFLIQSILGFINRLLGALAGIACIITFILSFGYRKENKKLILLT
jgi:cytochrome c oxidase assembly protein subunit 15